jgi:HK97 family phage major capsid protein
MSGPIMASERQPSSELRSQRGPWQGESFGSFLSAVVRAGVTGNADVDKRLLEARASGLQEGVSSEGGFLVGEDYSNALVKSIFETGKLAKLCQRFTITKPSNTLNLSVFNESSRETGSRLGGVRGYWLEEAGTKQDTKPDFGELKLVLKKLVGLTYVTDEILEDVPTLERIVRQGFADEFGFLLDDAIVNGTGSGMPLGILNSPSLVTVSKETGQAAATIQSENLLKMWSRCLNPENAYWLCNRDILPQLYSMGITIGVGGAPIFMPAGGISGQPFNTILGRPVITIEQASTLGAKGDITLADLSGFILADKGGVQSASSIHVKFTTDETALRFVYRVDGQPMLSSAITPASGSGNTLSHFVTLQARG